MMYEAIRMEPGSNYLITEHRRDGTSRVITVVGENEAEFWEKELRNAYALGASDQRASMERESQEDAIEHRNGPKFKDTIETKGQ